uniref:Mitochondrial inner membrane protease ATP23 n=1 Tax=Daphnia lumholtzi TaxID=42856 RepID=A0A4Y7M7F0_9CRUS|nr:EOG090X0CKN [Daphnia lumholtzi]
MMQIVGEAIFLVLLLRHLDYLHLVHFLSRNAEQVDVHQLHIEGGGGRDLGGGLERERLLNGDASRSETRTLTCQSIIIIFIVAGPLVKLMYSALKASGCEINLRRHIACEVCDIKVSGGYDPRLNQIVICQNVARSKGMVQGILTHEMIHMFDACRHELNFKDLNHLACTEIRAANLTHCSFLSAMTQGDASFFRIQKQHAECVKNKALGSVLAVRSDVTKEEALAVIDKVFLKCYNDLEPIGRRVRRNSADMIRAYKERVNYGYE